jgi:hypothetical protein
MTVFWQTRNHVAQSLIDFGHSMLIERFVRGSASCSLHSSEVGLRDRISRAQRTPNEACAIGASADRAIPPSRLVFPNPCESRASRDFAKRVGRVWYRAARGGV